ncbi:MAG TPA: LacI family DNA-binding transcriptional regulator [Chthoniobacteraceae bacterium]|nr:LacI family DNA-binding transcriptional regulator [Chthoniobacteraceae bacterium]
MAGSVSMSDVARRAGVHQSTVSLALRNDLRLPVATRERLQALAREMGYRPNPLVSALISERKRRGARGGRGSVLAFLTSHQVRGQWRHSPVYHQLFERMVACADERGYGLEEFWLGEPGMTPGRMKRILEHRGIRGIVVCPLQGTSHTLDFDFSSFAAVALGYTLRAPVLDHVSPDYGANMTLAVTRLLEEGFRRVLFITTQDMEERVNHLALGAYLVQRYLRPGKVLAPQVLQEWSKAALSRRLAAQRPEVILTSILSHKTAFKSWFGERYPVVILDCHCSSVVPEGIIRSVDEEAQAAISFVTSQVERARFGLPSRPRSILISGRWSDNIFPVDPHPAASHGSR